MLLGAGCTTSPMMTDIQRAVDGGDAEAGGSGDPIDLDAGSSRLPAKTPVRRTDATDASRNPFALTGKGQEIERSLGVDR